MTCCTGAGACPSPAAVSTACQGGTTCTAGVTANHSLSDCGEGDSVVACTAYYSPPTNLSTAFYEVPVSCGPNKDVLRLLRTETALEIRVFTDHTLVEGYFQKGRVAMTLPFFAPEDATVALEASADVAAAAQVFPVREIWTTAEAVRAAPRVFKTDDLSMPRHRLRLVASALLLPCAAAPQPPFRLYVQPEDPHSNPVQHRHFAKSPVWGNVTLFGAYRGNAVSADLDAYQAIGLGDLVWPPFPFMYAPNLTGRLDDIKRRGMKLVDVSQYIPGDTDNCGPYKPGETSPIAAVGVCAYKAPRATLDLVNAKLGEHPPLVGFCVDAGC